MTTEAVHRAIMEDGFQKDHPTVMSVINNIGGMIENSRPGAKGIMLEVSLETMLRSMFTDKKWVVARVKEGFNGANFSIVPEEYLHDKSGKHTFYPYHVTCTTDDKIQVTTDKNNRLWKAFEKNYEFLVNPIEVRKFVTGATVKKYFPERIIALIYDVRKVRANWVVTQSIQKYLEMIHSVELEKDCFNLYDRKGTLIGYVQKGGKNVNAFKRGTYIKLNEATLESFTSLTGDWITYEPDDSFMERLGKFIGE